MRLTAIVIKTKPKSRDKRNKKKLTLKYMNYNDIGTSEMV